MKGENVLKRALQLLLVAALALTAACATPSQPGQEPAAPEPAPGGGSSPPAASAEPIKIGVVMDQTGSASYYSQESLKGAQLAVDLINASGGVDGRQLELSVEDDQNNPAQSAQKVRKLASDKQVLAILSVSGSASSLQNRMVAEEEKVPEMAPTNINDKLTAELLQYFFRLSPSDSHYFQFLMDTTAQRVKKVAIFGDNTQTGLATTQSYADALKERGVDVVAIEQVDTGATDATPQVLRMKEAGADFVLLTAQGVPELVLGVKTIRQMNWDVPIMGTTTVGTPAFVDLAQEAADGVLFTDIIDDTKPAFQTANRAWIEKYGTDDLSTNAILTYDGVVLLVEAMKKGGVSREGIRNGLEQLGSYDKAATGRVGSTVNFTDQNHQGYGPDAVVIRTFQNLKPTTYTEK